MALRRQQAQEEEMGICNPVNLSNADIVVKNEPSGDLLFAVGGRSPSSATTSAASSPSASGELKKKKNSSSDSGNGTRKHAGAYCRLKTHVRLKFLIDDSRTHYFPLA